MGNVIRGRLSNPRRRCNLVATCEYPQDADGLAVGQQEVRRVELLERAAYLDRLGTLL